MGQILTRPEARPPRSRHRRPHQKATRLSRVTVDELYEGSEDEDSDVPDFVYRPSRSTLSKRRSQPLSEISGNPQRFSDIAAAGAAVAVEKAAKRAQDQKKRAQTTHSRRLREEGKTRKTEKRRSKPDQSFNIESQTRRRNTRTNTHTRHTTRRRSRSPVLHDIKSSSPLKFQRITTTRYNDYSPKHQKPTTKTKTKTKTKSRHHHHNHNNTSPNNSSTSLLTTSSHSPKKQCPICTSTRPLHHFPLHPPTSTCTHPPNTCTRCLQSWLSTQFTTKLWNQLSCPECPSLLTHTEIRTSASPALFRRYDTLSTRAALEAIPGFAWCIARGCKSGQVVEQAGANPKFKCVACKAVHCLQHGVMWHKGETCAQYDYRTDRSIRKKEDEASRKLVGEMAKRCPGAKCGWGIEKNNGCDHMTCSKCRHQFCWVCLAAYKPIRDQGNHRHKADCLHYAPPA